MSTTPTIVTAQLADPLRPLGPWIVMVNNRRVATYPDQTLALRHADNLREHLLSLEAMDADHDQPWHRGLAMAADQIKPGPQHAELVLARLHRAHGQHEGLGRSHGRRRRINAETRIQPQHAGGDDKLWQQSCLPGLEIGPHALADANRMVGQ